MNKIDRLTIAKPSKPIGMTLAAVVKKIIEDDHLSPTRKRDMISAINQTCRMIGRDPKHMTSDIQVLKAAFNTVHPSQHGISRKTLQNIKSNLLAAIRHATGDDASKSDRQKLTPVWQELIDRLPNRRFRAALSRLSRYCSAKGIEPKDVCDDVVDAFMNYVRTETFAKKPNDVHRRATRVWNEAVIKIPDWPQIHLTVPDFRKPRQSFPPKAFPSSFQKDVQNHAFWISGQDIMADNPPPKACKPRTIQQREKTIYLIASALVHEDWPIEKITSLANIISPDAMKTALGHYLKKTNQKPSTFMHAMAKAIISIARHYVRVDADHVEALKDIKRRLGSEPVGLTEKNKATLRQFEHDDNVLNLLDLPERLMDSRALKKLSPYRRAVRVQLALVISILQHAPLRMNNLTLIRLDTHIIRPGGYDGPVHIVIPEDEAKGAQTIEYPLQGYTRELLDEYLSKYRPLIYSDDCPWLFPTKGGKCKAQQTLAQQIKETVFKYTGIKITPHQFRHLAAKLSLDDNPGNFETVRQLLAHTNGKSTTNFYAELQTVNAARHYDRLLEQKREQLAAKPPKRRRKGKK
jgi:integrase